MRRRASFPARLLAALALLLLALVPLASAPATAQTFPALTGRVVDDAHLLTPERKTALDAKLATLEKQSGRQLVVVTLPDLQGYDIADYGFRLGDHWGIGTKDRDDGVLLIVAPKERKVRIEVGYGLEGILTDALSGRIIRDSIIPRFKQNDFPGGIEAGVDALSKLLTLPPDEARKLADQARRDDAAAQDNAQMVGLIVLVLLFVVLPWLLRRGRGGRGGDFIAPIILWGPGGGGRGSGRDDWPGGGFSGGGGGFGGGGASGGW